MAPSRATDDTTGEAALKRATSNEISTAQSRAHTPPSEPDSCTARCCCRKRKCCTRLRAGIALTVVGVLLGVGGLLLSKYGNEYWEGRIRDVLVVDSKDHPQYDAWVHSSASKTPFLHTYHFYNITNPEELIAGALPRVEEVGPFTFKEASKEQDVQFFENGNLVSYVTKYQYTYQGGDKDLDAEVNTVNLAYTAGVTTVGGEKNLLRMGTKGALVLMQKALTNDFVAALKESAVVLAITTATGTLTRLLNMTRLSTDEVPRRWGGGCSAILTRECGFQNMGTYLSLIPVSVSVARDVAMLNLALNTNLTSMPIPVATVQKLWDKTTIFSPLNTDMSPDKTQRYGVSFWLWGDDVVKQSILAQYQITSAQFDTLRAYLRTMYHSPVLEETVIDSFLKTLSNEERAAVQSDIQTWDDLPWRQWAVGDVVSRLSNMSTPISLDPSTPPEFAWYAEGAGTPTFKYDESHRLNKTQVVCLFANAAGRDAYWQSNVAMIPQANPAKRHPFTDQGLPTIDGQPVTATDIRRCFASDQEWQLLQGYLDYVSLKLVAPEMSKMVLANNGGLITTQTVRSILFGHSPPLLQLSLAADDPRQMFSILVNDTSLDGPATCTTNADIDNIYTACALSDVRSHVQLNGTTTARRVFKKVPSVFHTGKDDVKRISNFYSWHGETLLRDLWPNGTIDIEGGVQSYPGTVQYGFSEGLVYPPFHAVSKAGSLSVFFTPCAMPLRLHFQSDVTIRGVDMKRFALAAETFSSRRDDATTFSMGKTEQDGLVNVTDLLGSLTYFGKPHDRGAGQQHFANVLGLRAFDPQSDDSYIDVEPITGRTFNARLGLQLSAGIDKPLYNVYYPTMQNIEALPLFYKVLHADLMQEDADMFHSMVIKSRNLLSLATSGLLLAGGVVFVVGVMLLIVAMVQRRRRVKRGYSAYNDTTTTASVEEEKKEEQHVDV